MNKYEEIAEVDFQLQKNTEDTQTLQQCLLEIQHEEDAYRDDSRRCASDIERLSDVVHCASITKAQAEAFAALETMKRDVDRAIQAERERIRDELQALFGEKDALMHKKKSLEEEVE